MCSISLAVCASRALRANCITIKQIITIDVIAHTNRWALYSRYEKIPCFHIRSCFCFCAYLFMMLQHFLHTISFVPFFLTLSPIIIVVWFRFFCQIHRMYCYLVMYKSIGLNGFVLKRRAQVWLNFNQIKTQQDYRINSKNHSNDMHFML